MPRSFGARLVNAGLLVAFSDFVWAVVLTATNGRPPMSVWNGVASVAFGPTMLQAGLTGILVGLAMHVTVAFSWSALFLAVETNVATVRRWVSTRDGMLAVGLVYGPIIWTTMSCVVIPTMTGNAPNITPRWFVQLAGHSVFVGIPIVYGARR